MLVLLLLLLLVLLWVLMLFGLLLVLMLVLLLLLLLLLVVLWVWVTWAALAAFDAALSDVAVTLFEFWCDTGTLAGCLRLFLGSILLSIERFLSWILSSTLSSCLTTSTLPTPSTLFSSSTPSLSISSSSSSSSSSFVGLFNEEYRMLSARSAPVSDTRCLDGLAYFFPKAA